MKTIIIFLIALVSCYPVYSQNLLDREDDLSDKAFRTEGFRKLSGEFALGLAEQKAKTLISSIANQALASAPFVGTSGVAAELGITNQKMDELLVSNQQYNYTLSKLLGNILKVVKESRDGTMVSRTFYSLRKVQLIDESIKTIKKCHDAKRRLEQLRNSGYSYYSIENALYGLDVSVKALERLILMIEEIFKHSNNQSEIIRDAENQLNDINLMIDNTYGVAEQEINDKIAKDYVNDYRRHLIDGTMYYNRTKQMGEAKQREYIIKGRNAISQLIMVMKIIFALFAILTATSILMKYLYHDSNNTPLGKHIKSWALGMCSSAIILFICTNIINKL